MPPFDAIVSAPTKASTERLSEKRSPVRMPGSESGKITSRMRRKPRSPYERAASTTFRSTLRIAAEVLMYIGNVVANEMSATFGSSPMPIQTTNKGMSARNGTVLNIWRGASKSSSPILESPDINPSENPRVTPIAKPTPASDSESPIWPQRSCENSVPKVLITVYGVGNEPAGNHEALARTHQRSRRTSGDDTRRPKERVRDRERERMTLGVTNSMGDVVVPCDVTSRAMRGWKSTLAMSPTPPIRFARGTTVALRCIYDYFTCNSS